MNKSNDEFTREGGGFPSSAGLTSGVLPEVQTPSQEVNSYTGVSTQNTLKRSDESSESPRWYALRCTYGREKKAYEYLLNEGIRAFYPTITTRKSVNGKKKMIEESRLPNIFFAYSKFSVLKTYVYDNMHDATRYLRFYYNQHHDGTREPLVVPDRQIRSLMLICDSNADDILLKPFVVEKFLRGQRVIITEGDFAGVEGIVSRFQGQQRVGVVIEGLMTIVTAYVPSAFLERID